MSRKFRFSVDSFDAVRQFGEHFLGIHQDKKDQEKMPEKAVEHEGEKAAAPSEEAQVPAVSEEKAIAASEKEQKAEKDQSSESAPIKPAFTPLPADEKHLVCRTDIGFVRSSNQDAVICAKGLFGVADGMGGQNGGETASSMARELVCDMLADKTPSMELLKSCVRSVNRRIYARSREDKRLEGMGTTLTVIWYDEDNLFLGHVGDSRAYRQRQGEMKQMTDDHSYVAELVRQGLITKDQADCHPMRNIITRAVGTEDDIEVDISWHKRHRGDRWLICSDGLHGMLTDTELSRTLTHQPLSSVGDSLITAALDAGGRDNISLVLFDDMPEVAE